MIAQSENSWQHAAVAEVSIDLQRRVKSLILFAEL
jgi:hypothetical protein